MKDSGIPWIGEIPADWEVGRIGGLYRHRNTKVSDVDYPPLSVTMQGIVPQLETAAKSDDHDNRKLVRIGDFAINSRSDRRGSCGVSAYDGSVSLINTVMEPREKMSPAFYNLLFHTVEFADEFYKWGHGIVDDLWTTHWQDMKAMKVPLPSLKEQQRIADYLDERCAVIDEVRRTIEDEVEALRRLRKATIHRAVTKGLDEGVPMRDSGVEWIGSISAGWEIRRLKYLVHLNVDKSPETENYIGLENVESFTGRHIGLQLSPEGAAVRFNEGDVLFGKLRPYLAKVYYAREDGCCSSEFLVMRPGLLESRYLMYLMLNSAFIDFVNSSTYGTKMPRANWGFIGSASMPHPPFVEQQRIADYLDERCAAIDSIIDTRTKQLERLEDYRKALIFAYVTGKKEVPTHA